MITQLLLVVLLIGGICIQTTLNRIHRMSLNIQQLLDQTAQRVSVLTTTAASAEALLGSLKASLDAALAELTNQGVTPQQLQSLSDLSDSIGSRTTELAAAVTANTPSANEPPPADTVPAGDGDDTIPATGGDDTPEGGTGDDTVDLGPNPAPVETNPA